MTSKEAKREILFKLNKESRKLNGKRYDIAEGCNVSYQTVVNVLRGKTYNEKVVEYCVNMLSDMERKRIEMNKALDEAVGAGIRNKRYRI